MQLPALPRTAHRRHVPRRIVSVEAAVEAFAAAVGAEAVIPPGDARLAERGDPMAFGDETHAPAAVVSPGSVEEVQAVVRLAVEHGGPLWTASRGRNLAYGGAATRVAGSVLLDLSRMNRILEIDEACGVAIIEPGVSFLALDEHLRETGSGLMISAPDLGWGSVIGNSLERGFGYTAHGEHAQMVCGLEVVLSDGTLIRTGMGAQPGGRTWGHYKGGFGPSLDGLFMQSNFGVVTKMGHWLMPRPETVGVGLIKLDADADV